MTSLYHDGKMEQKLCGLMEIYNKKKTISEPF